MSVASQTRQCHSRSSGVHAHPQHVHQGCSHASSSSAASCKPICNAFLACLRCWQLLYVLSFTTILLVDSDQQARQYCVKHQRWIHVDAALGHVPAAVLSDEPITLQVICQDLLTAQFGAGFASSCLLFTEVIAHSDSLKSPVKCGSSWQSHIAQCWLHEHLNCCR